MAFTDSPYLRAHARGRFNLQLLRDRLLVFAAILALWEAMRFLGVNPLWISSPSAVGARLLEIAASGELVRHTHTTLTEAALGLLLAFTMGVPIGIAMARFRYAHAVAEPFIMALYSLPRVALAPLFIIWFGIDLFSKVMMSFSTVLFIFMLNIHEGLKTIDKDLLELFRTMKAPRGYVLRKVILPWLVPWVIASLRIGIGLSLIGAVVAELIGSSTGLGWYIEYSAGRLDTTGVFAGLVLLTVIAVVGNLIVGALERHYSSWRPS
ncbi:ABC transporter permease [Brucella intermedia]|uniref:ABC transporter permease n=1 Tax=Brucella intermedia TaxID=94625 RepID=UPI00224A9C0E|nr:ABC transporter permease [Brucella intermedia]